MSDADTLRVLNRQVERNNELETALFKASWERMVFMAAISQTRTYFPRTAHIAMVHVLVACAEQNA